MLSAVGARVEKWIDASGDPFTNVYGLARTLLALAGAASLLATPTSTLFFPVGGVHAPYCSGIPSAGLFCAVGDHLGVARIVAALLLFVVASGWRPRVTGVLHAWLAFSLQVNIAPIEGGDQIASILALLLVPVTLLDDRKWHWQARPARALDERERARRLVARVFFGLVRLQVAGIYFHACVGKFKVPEWTDGTAIYYWLTHPTFAAPTWIMPIVRPVLLSPAVALVTWGVLALEFALAAALFARRSYRPWLLAGGIALHVGIGLLHGLVTFAFVMFGALILHLRPLERPFALDFVRARLNDVGAWIGSSFAFSPSPPRRSSRSYR